MAYISNIASRRLSNLQIFHVLRKSKPKHNNQSMCRNSITLQHLCQGRKMSLCMYQVYNLELFLVKDIGLPPNSGLTFCV